MIEIQADIPLGEAIRPSALAHSRVYRTDARSILLPAFALAGAIILSSIVGMLLPLLSLRLQAMASLLWIAGAFLGLIAALRLYSRQYMLGYLAGLRRMGSPALFHTTFRFDDEGLAMASQRSSYRAPWDSVLFVIAAPEHWLVQVDTWTIAIPRRIFPDAGAEQAFVALASECLGPEAKRRSVLARQ